MQSSNKSTSTDYQTFRRITSCISEAILPSDESTVYDIVVTSIVLVVSLIVVTPILVLRANISLLTLVPLAGLSYGVFLYYTDRVFSGLISAFFVLSIFQSNMPIIDGPASAYLNLYLADLLGIILLGILAYDFDLDFQRLQNSRLGKAAVLGFAAFVLWSYLAAAVGNGPSQIAATIFAIQQTRYLLLFVVSILIVIRMGPRFGIYPLLTSIAGNLLYAVVEAFSGNTLGLTYLGDSNGRVLSELVLGPWTFSTGLYAGGFVGNTRHLIGLLLLLLPFLVFWTVYGSRLVTIASVFGILGVEFIVTFGETDAGWMASILVLAIAGGFSLSLFISDTSTSLRGCIASVYGVGVSALLYSERFRGSLSSIFTGGSGTGGSGTGGSGTGGSGTGGSGTGGSGTGGSGTGELSSQERIVDLFSQIPLIEVNTLGIRLTQYAAALDLSFAHPLFGIGGYNFILISRRYLDSEMGIHNTFLSHLAAVGYPGMLAYSISVLSVLILASYRTFNTSGKERLFWGSALSGLLGFHAYSFWVVMYQWHAPNAGFWVFSGIIVGALAFDYSSIFGVSE